jgi:hypothetical protein
MKVLAANPVVQVSCYHFPVKTKLNSNFNAVNKESKKTEKKQVESRTHLGEVVYATVRRGR